MAVVLGEAAAAMVSAHNLGDVLGISPFLTTFSILCTETGRWNRGGDDSWGGNDQWAEDSADAGGFGGGYETYGGGNFGGGPPSGGGPMRSGGGRGGRSAPYNTGRYTCS